MRSPENCKYRPPVDALLQCAATALQYKTTMAQHYDAIARDLAYLANNGTINVAQENNRLSPNGGKTLCWVEHGLGFVVDDPEYRRVAYHLLPDRLTANRLVVLQAHAAPSQGQIVDIQALNAKWT